MQTLKKAFYGAVSGALMLSPLAASAAFAIPNNTYNVPSNTSVIGIISRVLQWLLALVGIISIVAIVVAGILYITAAGDEAQAEKAKSTLTYAIIGLIVALVGYIIVSTVVALLWNDATSTGI